MRSHPLVLLSIPAAGYVYLLIRQVGRGLGAAAFSIPIEPVMMSKILPGFDVYSHAAGIGPGRLAGLILMGPALTLLVGYVLLWVLGRGPRRGPGGLRLFGCTISYLGLILDPVYYAVIPLLRLGGEPETLAHIIGVSPIVVALPAMAVLGLNVMLTGRLLVPAIKADRGRCRL
jgi:hypothetical protein